MPRSSLDNAENKENILQEYLQMIIDFLLVDYKRVYYQNLLAFKIHPIKIQPRSKSILFLYMFLLFIN